MIKDLAAIGFDLDQTLYQDSEQIQIAVRQEIAQVLSDKLKISISDADREFQVKLNTLASGSKALGYFGVEEPRELLRDCLDRAAVERFLVPDPELSNLLAELKLRYRLFLVTDSRRESATKKLRALGVSTEIFDPCITWNGLRFKEDGSAFSEVEKLLNLKGNQICFIGNSLSDDIAPCRALGWTTIYLNKKSSEVPKYQIQKLSDLRELLLEA